MINLGLSRITALVSLLPTKQTWKAIHIAGTNGKGSVAAYLSSLFLRLAKPASSDAEMKIGRFTSPHLIDRWDCITINDQPVSESLFLQVEKQVQRYAAEAAESLAKKNPPHNGDNIATEFELLTATAFEIFSQQNCQVAIIECGLGGRLDATNVLKAGDVACSVITKIGMDHVGVLGDTLDAIAREKAAIVKRNIPMVIDGTNPFDIIESIAVVANSQNVAPSLSTAPETEDDWDIKKDQVVGRMPPHQYNNLVLALTAFTKSQPLLPTLDFSAANNTINIAQILTDVRTSYPARLQHLSITPLFPTYTKPILLDGAHNAQSAEVLKSYIDSLTSLPTGFFKSRFTSAAKAKDPKPRTWILAMSRGKDMSSILATILESSDHVITCNFSRVDGMPWISPMSPAALAREAKAFVGTGDVREASDVVHALQIATETCAARREAKVKEAQAKVKDGKGGKSAKDEKDQQEDEIEIVVAGSLYLCSDLLRAMRDGTEAVKARFEIGVAI